MQHRWLRATRLAALVCLVVLLAAPFWALGPGRSDLSEPVGPEAVLFPIAGLFPFLLLFLRLRRGASNWQARAKTALSWSAPWGFLLCALAVSAFSSRSGARCDGAITFWEVYWPALALTSAAFALIALFASRSISAAETGTPHWLGRTGKVAAWIVLILVIWELSTPQLDRGMRTAANEASAVGSMRTIGTAQQTYGDKHPEKGFARKLVELGPAPGEGLIDETLASGKKSGYRFDLIPGPSEAQGRTTSFTLTARPGHFGVDACRNYFTDESGVVRSTYQDRPATRQDLPLQ
jgi:hypothetical protein